MSSVSPRFGAGVDARFDPGGDSGDDAAPRPDLPTPANRRFQRHPPAAGDLKLTR